jgi:YggT family protein
MVAFQVLYWLIIARVILSFFRSPSNPVTRFIYEVTEPVLVPFRRILPKGGMIDFSPFLAILSLSLLELLLLNIIKNM